MPSRRFIPGLAAAFAAMAGFALALGCDGVRAQATGEVIRPSASIPGAAMPTAEQLFSPQLTMPLGPLRTASPASTNRPAGTPAAPPAASTHGQPAPTASSAQTAAIQPAAAPATPPAPATPQPPAMAQNVPLPTPRPAVADAVPPPPAQIVPPRTPSAGRPGSPVAVAPVQADQDRAAPDVLQKVSDYWNRVQMLSGKFVQVDPDGSRKTGDFYMQKPGRVRFEYDAPVPLELISNGQSVAIRDRKLNTQDITPLSQTPLRFLLAETTDLARDPHVVGAYQDTLYITVVMEEKVPMMGTYKLMLLFDAKTYALKQWIVTDPQGYDTSVAISNLNYNARPDPRLFVINFDRMLQ